MPTWQRSNQLIKTIKCSDFDQNVCVRVCGHQSLTHSVSHTITHSKWTAIHNVMMEMVKLFMPRIASAWVHVWRSDTMSLWQRWWVLLVSAHCIWQQGDVTVNGSVMTTGWFSHSWLPLHLCLTDDTIPEQFIRPVRILAYKMGEVIGFVDLNQIILFLLQPKQIER